MHLKLSRAVLFQQSDLRIRDDEIRFAIFGTDTWNTVEERLN